MEAEEPVTLSVGQGLYYVPKYGDPRIVTVTKVGRKWATIGEGYAGFRIDLQTLAADGGDYSSPGQCYLSQAEYKATKARRGAWDEFRRVVDDRYAVPPHLSIHDINEMAQKVRGE